MSWQQAQLPRKRPTALTAAAASATAVTAAAAAAAVEAAAAVMRLMRRRRCLCLRRPRSPLLPTAQERAPRVLAMATAMAARALLLVRRA